MNDYGIEVLSVDRNYIEFVRTEIPALFFPAPQKCVKAHYEHILSHSKYSQLKFGRNFVLEWETCLVTQVIQAHKQSGRGLVGDGFLLEKLSSENVLRRKGVWIRVSKRRYYLRCQKRPRSVQDLGALFQK